MNSPSFFFFFCRCSLSFYCLRPCPFCLSVLWWPFLFSVFVGCHVSVSPLLSLQSCPLFFATRSYFRTISISFFVTLPQSKLCPLFFKCHNTVSFLSPRFFFRVTSFSVPLSAVFFLQVSVRRGFTFSQDRQPVERGLLADQRLRL